MIKMKAEQQEGKKNKSEELKRDTTPMPSYYKNWDKIDVEEASKKIDNEEAFGFDRTMTDKGKEIQKTHYDMMSEAELK